MGIIRPWAWQRESLDPSLEGILNGLEYLWVPWHSDVTRFKNLTGLGFDGIDASTPGAVDGDDEYGFRRNNSTSAGGDMWEVQDDLSVVGPMQRCILAENRTMAVFCTTDSESTLKLAFASRNSGVAGDRFYIGISSTNSKWLFGCNNTTGNPGNNTITLGQPTFLALSATGTANPAFRWYINDGIGLESHGNVASTGALDNARLHIGNYPNDAGGGRWWNGDLYWCALWSRVLTDGEKEYLGRNPALILLPYNYSPPFSNATATVGGLPPGMIGLDNLGGLQIDGGMIR